MTSVEFSFRFTRIVPLPGRRFGKAKSAERGHSRLCSSRMFNAPERPAIVCSVMHKIVRPDMIAVLRAQPDT